MNIDLLAKMVKEAVMDHDSVTLPGMGSFVAELVPASFTDRGYTILPPYRRLYFSPKQGNDRLLVELYTRDNKDISEGDAARILEEFILEMKEVLKERKTLVLTGLGRLRATRENHFFFVADEDLDIYPAGFGLQPISLKTHEETPEEVAAAVSNLAEALEAEPAPAVEPEADTPSVAENKADAPSGASAPVSPEAPSSEAPAEETPAEEAPKKSRRGWKVFGRILLWLLIIAVVAAVAVAVVGRLAPEWLDSFLYSPEELQIIHG